MLSGAGDRKKEKEKSFLGMSACAASRMTPDEKKRVFWEQVLARLQE
jgi:hypothetical protein